MKIVPLIAVFDNRTSIIPGHTIKEAAPPHTPIAIIPKGTTPVSIKSQREYAALFAAAPDLLEVCRRAVDLYDHDDATSVLEWVNSAEFRSAITKAGT